MLKVLKQNFHSHLSIQAIYTTDLMEIGKVAVSLLVIFLMSHFIRRPVVRVVLPGINQPGLLGCSPKTTSELSNIG